MTRSIYKIVGRQAWAVARREGVFLGAEIDLADGYIHFSTADQAQETADKHFAGQTDLLLVRVDAESLGTALRWEKSRGGQLFPHLYGHLTMEHVHSEHEIEQDDLGRHVLPILED